MTDARDAARRAEAGVPLPAAAPEEFSGYGIMGLPFSTGHVLAMRRFPASSVGPGYTSVWVRDPEGGWHFYSTVEPLLSCGRYFGAALDGSTVTAIGLEWTGPRSLRVTMPDVDFAWDVQMQATVPSRLMNGVARVLPGPAWRSKPVLGLMARAGSLMLRAGTMRLAGQAPNGQGFIANPRRIWPICRAAARLGAMDFGEPQPVHPQARLGDFWIPQCGLFVIGYAGWDAFDPARHLAVASRGEAGER